VLLVLQVLLLAGSEPHGRPAQSICTAIQESFH
jgi:hypothetical protein